MPLSACFKPLTSWRRVPKEKLLLHPSCPLFLVQALHLYSMCTFQMSCTDQQQVYMGLQSSQQQACAHIQSSSGLRSVSYSSPHQTQTFGLELHKYMSSIQSRYRCWLIVHQAEWAHAPSCTWFTTEYTNEAVCVLKVDLLDAIIPFLTVFITDAFILSRIRDPLCNSQKSFFLFFYTSYKTFPDPCHLDMCHAHLNMRRTTVQTSK